MRTFPFCAAYSVYPFGLASLNGNISVFKNADHCGKRLLEEERSTSHRKLRIRHLISTYQISFTVIIAIIEYKALGILSRIRMKFLGLPPAVYSRITIKVQNVIQASYPICMIVPVYCKYYSTLSYRVYLGKYIPYRRGIGRAFPLTAKGCVGYCDSAFARICGIEQSLS